MASRYRQRLGSAVSGSYVWYGTTTNVSKPTSDELMTDTVGNYGKPNPLDKSKYKWTGGKMHRSGINPTIIGCPSALYDQRPGRFVYPSPWSYSARLLAGTGPLSPRVNLPLYLYELKDIPMMLRHAGDLLHKIKRGWKDYKLDPAAEAASSILAYQFGWAPLYQDVMKLLNFADAVKKQQKLIQGAHSEKGIRRRLNLDEYSWSTNGSTTAWSTLGHSATPKYLATHKYKVWGTVNWKVRDPSKYGKEPSFTDVTRTALGLNAGMIPITIWKALPWSWMIDWFADISNVMLANYNSIYYRPKDLCIMRQTSTYRSYEELLWPDGSVKLTAATVEVQRKERFPDASPSVTPTLRLPFMDDFKLSILGSLSILKIKSKYS